MRPIPPQAGKATPVIIGLVALLAAFGGVWLGNALQGAGEPPELAGGMLLTPPKTLEPFRLVDHDGQTYDLQRLQDRWTFMFFGYTNCPDVCPNTMGVLNAAMGELEEHPEALDQAQVTFVSVDPKRDTPKQLAGYVPYFNQQFVGVTGELEAISGLTRQLGILYVHNGEGDDYTVDHSASILLTDPAGRLAAVFSGYPHDPRRIAADYLKIRQFYEE